jgi:HEAT repeat protein
MKTKKTWNKFSMLGLVARSLNACGSAVLFSYDTCSSSLEKVYDLSKKTSSASINLFRSPKRIISPQKTTQLIKKIKMCVHNLNNLYRKLGRRVMEATDPDHPFASEEMQSLLAEVKDFKSKVELLKERLVALEGRERANLLLKKELKAYARHSAKTAKRYGKGEPEIQEAVAHAITDAEAQVAFVSESDRITFRTVAGDLLEKDMEIKVLAAVELGRMRCGAAVNVLKEALKYDDPRLTLEIVRSLSAIGDFRALPILFEQVASPNYLVRIEALIGLCTLGSDDEVMLVLLEALKDKHPEVCRTAVTLLGWRKEFDAVSALVECIDNPSEETRKAIISALLAIGDRSALPALIDLLGDKSREVREKALAAIRDLTNEDISFEVETRGRQLTEATERVRERFQETSVSDTPAEVMQAISQRTEPVSESSHLPSQETEEEEAAEEEGPLQELQKEIEIPIDTVEEKVILEIVSAKIREKSKSSKPQNLKLYSEERLKKMIRPQLLSLCKSLNIECDYTDTKAQIISRILEHKEP